MKTNEIHASSKLLRLALLSCLVLVATSATAADEPGYGFYRTVEGDVRLTTLSTRRAHHFRRVRRNFQGTERCLQSTPAEPGV